MPDIELKIDHFPCQGIAYTEIKRGQLDRETPILEEPVQVSRQVRMSPGYSHVDWVDCPFYSCDDCRAIDEKRLVKDGLPGDLRLGPCYRTSLKLRR